MIDWIIDALIKVALLAPPILLALTLHEVAHGVVALSRGDATAKEAGRLTLNPLRHLDVTGTLVFFITAWLGAGIGWAKPVPVDYRRMRDPRRDIMWVSAAGPAVNLLTACVAAVIFNLLLESGLFAEYAAWKLYLGRFFYLFVQINVVLAFFNLIPLPPLDGSGILSGLLPLRAAAKYHELSRYGFIIILALILLPGWVPGFPDVIRFLVVRPALAVVAWLVPMLA